MGAVIGLQSRTDGGHGGDLGSPISTRAGRLAVGPGQHHPRPHHQRAPPARNMPASASAWAIEADAAVSGQRHRGRGEMGRADGLGTVPARGQFLREPRWLACGAGTAVSVVEGGGCGGVLR